MNRVRIHSILLVRILAVLILPLVANRGRCATTIVVHDGDSLADAVASAATDTTIRIDSNQTFVGTLSWKDKYLTIKAGPGFHPTIKGDPFYNDPTFRFGRPAIFDILGNSTTGGLFEGLKLQTGDNAPDPPGGLGVYEYRAVLISGTGAQFSNVVFQNNDIVGAVTLGGTGELAITANYHSNHFFGPVTIGGTGSLHVNATMNKNLFDDRLRISGNGFEVDDVTATNNFFIPSSFATSSGILVDSLSSVNEHLLAINNVVVGSNGAGTGIRIRGDTFATTTARVVNNTVVGFSTGVEVLRGATASFENMVLNNTDDLGTFDGASIANSLIADGTLAGLNGNFPGIPMFGAAYDLLAGSIGIDAGNNLALNLLNADIVGSPRIIDGDGDRLARVDVGAFEFVPEPGSISLVALACIAFWTTGIRARGRAL
jgi:hypothetical protein